MAMKCINFTNGLRLPIFPSDSAEEYEENTRIFSPWGVVNMYAMKNAIITAADASGKFINPDPISGTCPPGNDPPVRCNALRAFSPSGSYNTQ